LAVVRALKEFRVYLEGSEFSILTDHENVTRSDTALPPSKRYARWLEYLQQFTAKIIHVQGSKNLADALSRRPDYAELASVVVQFTPTLLERISQAYAKDEDYADQNFIKKFQLVWDEKFKVWMHHDRVAVPCDRKLRQDILHDCHDSAVAGHVGRDRTLFAVAKRFWWPRMARQVAHYVASCPTCQRTKVDRRKEAGLLQPLPVPERPWQDVSLDFIVSLPKCEGYDSILTVTDKFSKMVHFIPCSTDISAEQTANLFIREIFRLHGMPRSIVSDRDVRFVSPFWKDFMGRLQTKLKFSTAYHPQTDGATERANQSVQQMLRGYVGARQDTWVSFLPLVEFAYNSSVHAATGTTPFFVAYGYEPNSPMDVELSELGAHGVDNVANVHDRVELHKEVMDGVRAVLKDANDRMVRTANANRRDVQFNVGDKVLLSTTNMRWPQGTCAKFVPKYLGPFAVVKKIGDVTYELQLPSTMRVYNKFHVSLLKPWVESSDDMFPDPRDEYNHPGPVDAEDNQWLVESILQGPKKYRRKMCYRIRWMGYGPEHDSWVPVDDISPDLIEEYEARQQRNVGVM
jgi:transposase InsO family protein